MKPQPKPTPCVWCGQKRCPHKRKHRVLFESAYVAARHRKVWPDAEPTTKQEPAQRHLSPKAVIANLQRGKIAKAKAGAKSKSHKVLREAAERCGLSSKRATVTADFLKGSITAAKYRAST